ncbi:MAG: 5'-nucleotidase C-terminal domain-containing protein [Eubacteriales bacterium]|nr:5'-nucleotidase C-terminal domain-containing protein [Eubacteriales bacterium]
MRKFLALILSLAMVLCLIPAVASADTGTVAAWTGLAAGTTASATTGTGTLSNSNGTAWSITSDTACNLAGLIEVGDYWQMQFVATGYTGLSITFSSRGSNTGAKNWKVQYSTDGTTFTDLASGAYSLTTTMAAKTFNFGTALDQAATAYIRLTVVDTVSVNNGTAASTGTNRLLDPTITGTVASGTLPSAPPSDTPTPPSDTPAPLTTSTIADAKAAYAGGSTATFKVEGIVTFMDPNSSGTSVNVYFEDATAGLDAYQTAANVADIAVGDKITVEGTFTTFNGLVEMGTSATVTKVASGFEPPVTDITLAEFAAAPMTYQCMRVRFSNVALASDGANISDGTNTLNTYKFPADVASTLLGAQVDVIGVIGWYNAAQLRVASASDVTAYVAPSETPPVPPSDTPEPPSDTPEPPSDTPEPPSDTPEPPTDTPEPPTDTPEPPVDDVVEIKLLGTSDIHGQLFATDYTIDASQSGTYGRALTRVATYVKEQRAAYDNVFLADTGDLIQGTPLTYYFAFNQPTIDDPAMKALRTMGYDLFVPGNHEFNYGMTILQRQLGYLTSADTATESQVAVSAANYLAAATNNDSTKDWATWNGYAPYILKEFDGVTVAIMGIGNPNVPKWDVPANWDGIYFAGVLETYAHYEAEMKAAADIIVIYSHSGIDSDEGSDFIRELITSTNSIDLAFTGHEHRNGVTKIANADGKEINVLSPYTKARRIADALLSYNKTTGELEVTATIVNTENYALDEELVDVLQPYETATWDDYMNEKIGEASAPYSALNLGTAPSAFMDLINRVQLWGAYDRTGENTANDPSDDTMAQLSISAPLTSGDATELIPQGDIFLGDMFKLYRYENWFYQITMSGKEVKTWLEFAATKITVDAQGNPNVSSGNLTYYDVIYGDGFYYMIDYTMPEGSRIVKMTYNGNNVADDDEFTVVVNNYRYNGGGNYVSYLNANGCEFVANDPDRVIYSTQYDMIQGEDKGQARNLLADYIRESEVIDPDITSTWELKGGFDYTINGEQGYQPEFAVDDDGCLIWNITLSELAEGEFLNSLQFTAAWDNTKLELCEIEATNIYEADPLAGEDGGLVDTIEILTNKVGGDLATASELTYAMASAYKAWLADGTDVVLSLMFKIKDEVAEETQIDIELNNAWMTLVDAQSADLDTPYVGTVDGFIIVRRVNKDALIAAVAAANEAMEDVATSADGKDLANGTEWLTEEEKAANEAAIAAAQAVIDDVLATQAEVDAALAALEAAFVEPHVALVDKTALIAEDAQDDAIQAGAAVSSDGKDLANGTAWLTPAEFTANAAALAAAQAVIDDNTVSQNTVDAALAALIAAFNTPNTATVDKAALIAEDAQDDAIQAGAAVSSDGKDLANGTAWLTPAEFTANAAALAAAQAVIDDNTVSQNTVDAALAALIAAFNTPNTATVDKAALIAEDANDDAIMANTALVIAANDDALPAGTLWLTEAEKTANDAALAAAQAVIDNAAATQNQVDAALAALIEAFIAPHAAVIDTARIEAAIAYAEEFIASDEYDDCSDELQDMWDAALADAQAELIDPAATQNSMDAAADAIYALDKTGESTMVYTIAGMMMIAMLGLAVGIKKRFFSK